MKAFRRPSPHRVARSTGRGSIVHGLVGGGLVAGGLLLAAGTSPALGQVVGLDFAPEVLQPDRRIDWNPGVPGGIPDVVALHSVLDFGAVGDGVTDDSAAFHDQNLLGNALTAEPPNRLEIDADITGTLVHGHLEEGTVAWDPETPNRRVPTTLYLQESPRFYPPDTAWPSTGFDREGCSNPAFERWLDGEPIPRRGHDE